MGNRKLCTTVHGEFGTGHWILAAYQYSHDWNLPLWAPRGTPSPAYQIYNLWNPKGIPILQEPIIGCWMSSSVTEICDFLCKLAYLHIRSYHAVQQLEFQDLQETKANVIPYTENPKAFMAVYSFKHGSFEYFYLREVVEGLMPQDKDQDVTEVAADTPVHNTAPPPTDLLRTRNWVTFCAQP
ncbi:hypothetical protein J6590_057728 [Homalodisca vitripennis]|nr:hypothetical protein J6590_057728 [Homalodisca vitripennis]